MVSVYSAGEVHKGVRGGIRPASTIKRHGYANKQAPERRLLTYDLFTLPPKTYARLVLKSSRGRRSWLSVAVRALLFTNLGITMAIFSRTTFLRLVELSVFQLGVL